MVITGAANGMAHMGEAVTYDEYPFEITNTAAVLLDARGRVLGWTEVAGLLLGRSTAEVCGRHVRELLSDPGSWPGVMAQRTGSAWKGEAVLRHGSGGELRVRFRVLPLMASPDEETRYLAIGAPSGLVVKWRRDHAFTQQLFAQNSIGFALMDPDLRFVRTNGHVLPYLTLPADVRGLRLAQVMREEDARVIEERLRGVMRSGEPLVTFRTRARAREGDADERVLMMSAFRLQEPDGGLMGAAAAFTDVTDHERARERLAILYRATVGMGQSLSVTRVSEELAEVLVAELADSAVVELADAVPAGDEPAPGAPPTLVRMAVARASADRLRPDSGGPEVAAPDDGRPTVGATPAAETAPRNKRVVTVPLTAGGATLGRITVSRTSGRRPFVPDEVMLVEEIASRGALGIDNARRFAREQRAAMTLQRSLLPPATSRATGVETASAYLPSAGGGSVSGDWFDVIPLSSARVALVVGDVAGHGLTAMATMGRLRTAVRTLADLDLDPGELLAHLDEVVGQLGSEAGTDDGGTGGGTMASDAVTATCLYAVYDPVSQRCAISSAGHPPPGVVAPDGTVRYVELNPGPPLGVGGLPFEPVETDIAPGSVLALFSDGLVERRDGDIDTHMAELAAGLARSGAVHRPLEEVCEDLARQLVPSPPPDDVTLLLARTRAVRAHDVAAWTLEPDPAGVAEARHAVGGQLTRWGLEELRFTTELVVSELVTNAIRYAGGPIELRLIRAGVLTCEVSDPSSTHPRMRRARSSDEGGRGLFLVAQLTDRWGSRYTRTGKTIWTEQSLPAASADGRRR